MNKNIKILLAMIILSIIIGLLVFSMQTSGEAYGYCLAKGHDHGSYRFHTDGPVYQCIDYSEYPVYSDETD